MKTRVRALCALLLLAASGCTSQPGAQASQAPAQQAGVARAACDNTYVPVKAGATWTFKNTNNLTQPLTQITTITDVNAGSFTQKVDLGDGTTWTETWTCAQGGLLQLQDNGGPAAAALGPSGKATVTTKSNTGITVPTDPKVGDTWSQTTETAVNSADLNTTESVTTTYKAIDMESVTVAAGTFDALRVDIAVTGTVTYQNGASMPVTSRGSTWLVRGNGAVKSTSATGSVVGEQDLQSYQIP